MAGTSIIKLFKRLGLLKKINISTNARIANEQVTIPILSELGLENLYLELWMCQLLKYIKKIKQGSFIDVGANVGQTLIKMRLVDKDIPYIGFEPNPECVYYMRALIKANQYKNTDIIPVGLFDQDAVLKLNLYSDVETDQSASLIENFRKDEAVHNKMFVPVFRFEEIRHILSIEEISVIKIDVEGAELEVLESLEQTILSKLPFIFIEILPSYSMENVSRMERQNKIENLLTRWNYHICRIHTNGNKVEKLELLSEIGIHSNIRWSDYVLAPASASKNLIAAF